MEIIVAPPYVGYIFAVCSLREVFIVMKIKVYWYLCRNFEAQLIQIYLPKIVKKLEGKMPINYSAERLNVTP